MGGENLHLESPEPQYDAQAASNLLTTKSTRRGFIKSALALATITGIKKESAEAQEDWKIFPEDTQSENFLTMIPTDWIIKDDAPSWMVMGKTLSEELISLHSFQGTNPEADNPYTEAYFSTRPADGIENIDVFISGKNGLREELITRQAKKWNPDETPGIAIVTDKKMFGVESREIHTYLPGITLKGDPLDPDYAISGRIAIIDGILWETWAIIEKLNETESQKFDVVCGNLQFSNPLVNQSSQS